MAKSRDQAVREILDPVHARGGLRPDEVEEMLRRAFDAGAQSIKDGIAEKLDQFGSDG